MQLEELKARCEYGDKISTVNNWHQRCILHAEHTSYLSLTPRAKCKNFSQVSNYPDCTQKDTFFCDFRGLGVKFGIQNSCQRKTADRYLV